jgi:hypothetical protein
VVRIAGGSLSEALGGEEVGELGDEVDVAAGVVLEAASCVSS